AQTSSVSHLARARAIERFVAEALAHRIERRVETVLARAVEEPELLARDQTRHRHTDQAHRARTPLRTVLGERVAEQRACDAEDRRVVVPTPQRRSRGSGARNVRSSPAGTTTRPSGLRRSEATFAQSLFVARPTESTSPQRSRTARLSSLAIASALPQRCSVAVTSRKASSSEIGSTSGVLSAKRAMTWSDASP